MVEVVVAFTILMITMLPLTYLYGSSIIQAGQSTNQQTALSIAEQWVETLSNVTPPVDSNGEVFVGTQSAPVGAGAATRPSQRRSPARRRLVSPPSRSRRPPASAPLDL